jgi:hypothetical protein
MTCSFCPDFQNNVRQSRWHHGGKPAQTIAVSSLQEIVMTSMRINASISPAALAIIACVSSTGAALASQGPGGGMGTASHFTQVVMAILVYGTAAIVVAAGLAGAARGR